MATGFISYKHDSEPDVRIANAVLQGLTAAGHNVFIDNQIRIGEHWPQIIEEKLSAADYVIVLLSEAATASEMIIEEVAMARRIRKKQGRPKILPVRVAYEEPFPYDLGAWLDRIQCAFWRKESDDSIILDQILAAIATGSLPGQIGVNSVATALTADGNAASQGAPMAPPLPAFDPRWLETLDVPGGAVRLTSPFYIQRDLDTRAKQVIAQGAVTLLIKGSRQTGKTSALARIYQHARDRGDHAVFIDFQRLDRQYLENLNTVLRYMADLISLKLKTNEKPDRYWSTPLGPKDKLTTFLEEEVLEHLASPLVLLMDEVDRVFAYPEYRDDFFGLVRSWHNNRAFNDVWDRLNLVLAYSTEAGLLITDQTQSPFNIGELLETNDFLRNQVIELNYKHGEPLKGDSEIDRIMELLAGHPFLIRKALYESVNKGLGLRELLARANDDDGPFGDHLQRHMIFLNQNPTARLALKTALRTSACETDSDFHVLRSAGLIKGHNRQAVIPRCGLYEAYFKNRL
ncbi:MAG: AAA-like domain-containing protein [Acidobacteriaceae bacterium]|nr:AAA-like domain-containing protein [Acidobacteriaceae bacterium]